MFKVSQERWDEIFGSESIELPRSAVVSALWALSENNNMVEEVWNEFMKRYKR